MKKEKNVTGIIKKVVGTLYIPVIIYFVIYLVAMGNGLTFFGDSTTWQNLIQSFAATATIAFALGIQIKNGRFDFSGGAVMTLGAILSVNIISQIVTNWVLFLIASIVICTILSCLVGVLYAYGRLPVIISTIGAAILYESFTLLINNGRGISISATTALNFLGKNGAVCMVLTLIAGGIYYFFTNYTVAGKHAQLLANNQNAAVNIGIKERKNVIISFIVTGVLYGIATVIFASQSASVAAVSATLGTISTAFGAILPVFMGFYIGGFSNDFIGILCSSFAVGTFKYGLSIIAPAGYSGAVTNIVYGIFLVAFFLVSHQGSAMIAWVKEKLADRRTGGVA
jgi:ribose transport system permease protein